MTTKSKKKWDDLKAALFSNDAPVVLGALDQLDEFVHTDTVEPLLVLFAQNTNKEIKAKLTDILSTLKVSGLEDVFMKALQAKEFQACRKDFIHFMWSSNVQPESGWMHLAEWAAHGTYEECIEILSLLDNTEQELIEEELLEAVSILKIAINEQPQHEALPIRQLLLEAFNERLSQ